MHAREYFIQQGSSAHTSTGTPGLDCKSLVLKRRCVRGNSLPQWQGPKCFLHSSDVPDDVRVHVRGCIRCTAEPCGPKRQTFGALIRPQRHLVALAAEGARRRRKPHASIRRASREQLYHLRCHVPEKVELSMCTASEFRESTYSQ